MVDIEALSKGVVNQLKVKSKEKNILLEVLFDTDIIEHVQGDKNRLRQVLINLVQNSIKFTEDGGTIKIVVSQDEEFTIIKVVDNGLGIKKRKFR